MTVRIHRTKRGWTLHPFVGAPIKIISRAVPHSQRDFPRYTREEALASHSTPIPKWKDNVRRRHQERVPLPETCHGCGKSGKAVGGLSRHHDWTAGWPTNPPKVEAILCKLCHAKAEGILLDFECPDCGKQVSGKGKHLRRCKARRKRLYRQYVEWAHGEALMEDAGRVGAA